MSTFVHQDLDVSAAKVVASGAPLYPAVDRVSAAPAITLNPNASPASQEQREKIFTDPGFGRYFTDNVVRAVWTKTDGWHQAELMAGSASAGGLGINALHYGQSIFE